MEEMAAEEMKAFLLDSPRTGKLATVREDGSPHVAPIWFTLDGDDILFTTWHTTVKAANLHRDGRVALCVDDDRPPYAFVIVEGRAHFVDDPDQLAVWARRIAGRFMGEELAESYGARNSVPGELLVRVKAGKWIGRKGISNW